MPEDDTDDTNDSETDAQCRHDPRDVEWHEIRTPDSGLPARAIGVCTACEEPVTASLHPIVTIATGDRREELLKGAETG